jgi:hypothetical protein
MDWAGNLDLWYPGDDVPWCELFAAHCIASQLPDEPLPDNPLGARNWLKFGRPHEPSLGAVLVFWRVRRDSWQAMSASMPARTGPKILAPSMCSAATSRTASTSRGSPGAGCSAPAGYEPHRSSPPGASSRRRGRAQHQRGLIEPFRFAGRNPQSTE